MINHLTYHTRFSSDDLDSEYNLRAGRPDYEVTVIPEWEAQSEAARSSLNCSLDIRYGSGEKQKLDVFKCQNVDAPTLIYFHGGYWQRGDKSIYSFLAPPFVKAGINVVVVGYDLCPSVTITQISHEAREAIAYIWLNSTTLGVNRDKITVMGHSAGGHITQMMMTTDWSKINSELPINLIAAGIPVSPLSYLEPVRLTNALNAGIRMDLAEADAQSPMTNHPPFTDAPQLVVVGGAETSEFHRQAKMYVESFATESRKIKFYVAPEVDHFDELNSLVDKESEFFNQTLSMLRRK